MGEYTRIRIKLGWDEGGKEGVLLAGPIRDTGGQDWMAVQWDGDDDPDMHKAAGLEVATVQWQEIKA